MAQTTHSYSHRAIWRIAAPMIVSGISVPLLGIADTAVAGHLEAPYFLAAVAAGATIFNVLFMGLNFLRMGTTGITAQACGADSPKAIATSLMQPLLIAMAVATLLIVLQAPIVNLALWLLDPSPVTTEYARQYFSIRIWGAPAALANFVLLGWLLGMQNARGPLMITLALNITNIILDITFVVGFGWEVKGVAAATLFAEYVGLAIAIIWVRKVLPPNTLSLTVSEYLNVALFRRLFEINGNLFLRSAALMFAFAFITAQGSRMGDLFLATNALLMNFLYLLSYALDGIAHAAEALTGKATGARDRAGLAITVRRTLAWTALFAILFALAYALIGPIIIDALTDIPKLRVAARSYLPWLIALPFTAAWCFLYDGVYVGTTRSREMRNVMVGSLFLVFLPVWYFLQPLGNHALWLALNCFMVARSASMHLLFRKLQREDRLIRDATTQTASAA